MAASQETTSIQFESDGGRARMRRADPWFDAAHARVSAEAARYFKPVNDYFARLEAEIDTMPISSDYSPTRLANFDFSIANHSPLVMGLSERDYRRFQLKELWKHARGRASTFIGEVEDLTIDMLAAKEDVSPESIRASIVDIEEAPLEQPGVPTADPFVIKSDLPPSGVNARVEVEKAMYFAPIVAYFAHLEEELRTMEMSHVYSRTEKPNLDFLLGSRFVSSIVKDLTEEGYKRFQLLSFLNQVRTGAILVFGEVGDLIMEIESAKDRGISDEAVA